MFLGGEGIVGTRGREGGDRGKESGKEREGGDRGKEREGGRG